MRQNRVTLSAAFILIGAFLYAAASFTELAAIAAPVIVHELGHIVTLRLCGLPIRRFGLRLRSLLVRAPRRKRGADPLGGGQSAS